MVVVRNSNEGMNSDTPPFFGKNTWPAAVCSWTRSIAGRIRNESMAFSPMPCISLSMSEIETRGFAIIRNVLNPAEQEELRTALGAVAGAGRRGVLTVPAVTTWAHSERLLALMRPHLPAEPLPVRGIFFDKSADANWAVAWHQDLTLALRERIETSGFGPWSVKDGIPHVQPPIALLEQMLTIRLHLDDADEDNGALRVLPGTHRLGRLSPERIAALRETEGEVLCTARAGDALLMLPLLLHASGKSTSGRNRRVLHLEYAGCELPEPLAWHEVGDDQTNKLAPFCPA